MTIQTLTNLLRPSSKTTHALAVLLLGAVFLFASPAAAAICDGHGDWNYWQWQCDCDSGYENAGRTSCVASTCSDLDLEEVRQTAAQLTKSKAFVCWQEFFTGLGPNQNETALNALATQPDNFTGTMRWFSGNSFVLFLAQYIWDGIDFDGEATGKITYNTLLASADAVAEWLGYNLVDDDIGVISYQENCPKLDNFPCLKIDFTAGSLPRVYYTRQVSETTYVSFVNLRGPDDGPNDYSDVNILIKK